MILMYVVLKIYYILYISCNINILKADRVRFESALKSLWNTKYAEKYFAFDLSQMQNKTLQSCKDNYCQN